MISEKDDIVDLENILISEGTYIMCMVFILEKRKEILVLECNFTSWYYFISYHQTVVKSVRYTNGKCVSFCELNSPLKCC